MPQPRLRSGTEREDTPEYAFRLHCDQRRRGRCVHRRAHYREQIPFAAHADHELLIGANVSDPRPTRPPSRRVAEGPGAGRDDRHMKSK